MQANYYIPFSFRQTTLAFIFLFFGVFLNRSSAQCTGLGSVVLNVTPGPVPTLAFSTQICPGDDTNISVNQIFDTYAWNTGEGSQLIVVNTPGTYTVTVSNSSGCSGTAQAVIGSSPVPTPSITQGAYACNGQFTLNAGAGFNAYAWSSGSTVQTTTVTSSDTYTVTVTNAQGCTGTDIQNVTIPDPPEVIISGDLDFCAGNTTLLSATPGFNTYSWSSGSGSANLNVSIAGTYTVTATDAFGCTDVNSVTVTNSPSPTPNINGPGQFCLGTDATLTVANGPFDIYAWSQGDNTPSITVASGGTYTVTVTAANGCTGTTTEVLIPLPAPNPNISQAPYACNGNITLNAGGGFTNYAWSTGNTTQNNTVNSDGSYTVTVTNGQGCTGTDTQFVTIPDAPNVTISGTTTFCTGSNTTLNATTGFNDYDWSNSGSTGSNLTVTLAGTYTVTVTDGFGCTDVSSAVVTSLLSPSPNISGPGQFCDGTSVTLSVANGPFTDFDWNNGSNSPTITVSNGGTYTVTVTATNGCTGTSVENLTEIIAPIPNLTQATYACNNTAVLNSNLGFSSYQWSNGATSGTSISVNTEGEYTVTVTNAQGCTGTNSIIAEIPPEPLVDISGSASICQGNTTTLVATTGFSQYAWSNGDLDESITINQSGTYFVTITDNFGCTAENSKSVNVLPNPNPQITGSSSICPGSNTVLGVSGTFNSYLWSNGSTNANITVNTPDTYEVVVTATNGCTGTDDVVVVVSNSLNINVSELPYACNGQITLDAGTGFNTYIWSNGATTSNISVAQNNTYTVTVTDSGSCTGTAAQTITIPTLPQVIITGPGSVCAGTEATLVATAGFSGYAWSNIQFNQIINVLIGGSYEVTITDVNGCTATNTFNLSVNAIPQPTISGSTTICANGTATFGTTIGYNSYLWSTSATSATIQTNMAGIYSVIVTDANGCSGTDDLILNITTSLSPSIATLPYGCNSQVSFDVGTGFQTYAWSSGSTTSTANVSANGTYTVTVSDLSGCTGTATATANIPAAPTVTIGGTNAICVGNNSVLNVGSAFSAYNWSNGATTATTSVTQPNTYLVTVTDAIGCTATDDFVVVVNQLPQTQITGSTTICNGNSTTISAGAGFAAYAWSNGATTASTSTTTAGLFTVTVTDAIGCSNTATITLTVSTSLSPSIATLPYGCNSQVSFDVGTGFQTYIWSSGSTTSTANVSANGTYTVTVSDLSGCTGIATATANIPAAPTVTIGGTNAICVGNNSVLNVGAAFAAYNWSNGATTATTSVTQPNTYLVTVTDAIGCTSTDDFVVAVNESPEVLITGNTTIDCDNGTANISISGGNALTYQWSNGATTMSVSLDAVGEYAVTVTDNAGCTNTEMIAINELAINSTFADTIEFRLGQVIPLVPPIGFTPANITWTNASILSCSDCIEPNARPTQTTLVNYEAMGNGPCEANGFFLLIQKSSALVYIPNAIAPGTSENGIFTIYGNELVEKINFLRIYDRWGELMFENRDMNPGDLTQGWNGTYKGKDLTPGVYVHVAELLFKDGKTEIFSGDITILK